jgi:hypothetical protein
MRLRSKLGTGTVVCVSLPCDARKARIKVVSELPGTLSGITSTVLLREDALV